MINSFGSKYLITWTGKDICCDLMEIDDAAREKYLDRLESILDDGFWLTREECEFSNVNKLARVKIDFNSRLCFTENRLTMSHEHTKRYGLMGFGFEKEFVTDRKGMPVKYVIDGENDIYLSVIMNLLMFFKDTDDENNYNSVMFLLGNMKPIRDPDSGINNMVENEWRIIYTNQNEEYIEKSNRDYPLSYLPFSCDELKMLILPDSKTKEKFFNRKKCVDWFDKSNKLLTIVAYEDVVSF